MTTIEREVLRAALALHHYDDDDVGDEGWETSYAEFLRVLRAYVANLRESRSPASLARAVLMWAFVLESSSDDDVAWDKANEAFWGALGDYGRAVAPRTGESRRGRPPTRRDALAALAGVPSESLCDLSAFCAAAKRAGVCQKCFKKAAVPGRSRCATCGSVKRLDASPAAGEERS